MHGRIKIEQEKGALSKETEMVGFTIKFSNLQLAQSLVPPLGMLKSMFPNIPLKKHATLDVILNPPATKGERTLIFRDIGRVENTWVAKQFFLAYFEGWGISPPVRAYRIITLLLLKLLYTMSR